MQPKTVQLASFTFPLGWRGSSINNTGNCSSAELTGASARGRARKKERETQKTCKSCTVRNADFEGGGWGARRGFLTDLTYELFPAMQVGGPENVVSFQWFQQKVVPDAGDAVRRVRGLRRAGGPEVWAETLARLCSPQARQFFEVVRFVPRSPIT